MSCSVFHALSCPSLPGTHTCFSPFPSPLALFPVSLLCRAAADPPPPAPVEVTGTEEGSTRWEVN